MNTREYKKLAKHIRSSRVYEVYDLKELQNLNLSLTELHGWQHTSGHYHDDADEIYLFLKGHGKIKIGEDFMPCSAGDVFLVPRGKFHKVWNESIDDLAFYAVFEKYGDRK